MATITLADSMPVFEALPAGPVKGAVIVLQEAFGVNAHIEDVTQRFADAGYHALAPHLFHRTGAPTFGYDDFSQVMEHMVALRDAQMVADVTACVAHLSSAGFEPSQIGVVGFCMGGRAAFLVAGNVALGAAVGFYGGGIVTARSETMPALTDLVASLPTPFLGLFGDADHGIPIDDVETLRTLLTEAPVPCEIVRYPEAEHGFHCDARPSYHPEAAKDAWAKTLDWLDTHLTPMGAPA